MGFEIDEAEIENRFGFHPATDKTRSLHEIVRSSFIEFVTDLIEVIPDGREKSLALTALQEAAMWSNAAVACNLAPLESSSQEN